MFATSTKGYKDIYVRAILIDFQEKKTLPGYLIIIVILQKV